jgi:hypothetical protein
MALRFAQMEIKGRRHGLLHVESTRWTGGFAAIISRIDEPGESRKLNIGNTLQGRKSALQYQPTWCGFRRQLHHDCTTEKTSEGESQENREIAMRRVE